jgi:hypothetical protein
LISWAGLGDRFSPPPGWIFIGPSHTFAGFADAINAGFARWDLSHLHVFELMAGRRIGFVDPDPLGDDEPIEDQAAMKVAEAAGPGDEFAFVFDFGDQWEHRCRGWPTRSTQARSGDLGRSKQPGAICGWGWIPDQYGRESAAELDLEP